MTHIPGTTTTADFIQLTGKYPPLFYSSAETTRPTMGSVNAGNQALYVGGAGINQGFERALQHAGQDTSAYSTRQNALLQQTAVDATGAESYAATDPISFSSFINSPIVHDTTGRTGLTFVDVFDAKLRPHGNLSNVAMIYTTAPDGRTYQTRDAFLTDIAAAATKLVRSVAAFNAGATASGVPTVEAVRMCLFSSGIFNAAFDENGDIIAPPTSKPKVALDVIALRIYDGLVSGLTEAPSGINEIQFPYSTNPHDPLYNAVRNKLTA